LVVKAKASPFGGFDLDNLDLDNVMADFEQTEATRIKNNIDKILSGVKMPEIEDLVSEQEPEFPGLDDIFNGYNKKRIDYFAKWMDLILLEEHTAFERQRKRARRNFSSNELCLEFENLIDVRLK
jgi:hypothetical protein